MKANNFFTSTKLRKKNVDALYYNGKDLYNFGYLLVLSYYQYQDIRHKYQDFNRYWLFVTGWLVIVSYEYKAL